MTPADSCGSSTGYPQLRTRQRRCCDAEFPEILSATRRALESLPMSGALALVDTHPGQAATVLGDDRAVEDHVGQTYCSATTVAPTSPPSVPCPRESPALAAAGGTGRPPRRRCCRARHSRRGALHHATQPLPLSRDGLVPAPLELVLDLAQLRPHPFRDGDTPQPEPAAVGPRADVREAEEVEDLRLTLAPLPSSLGGEPPELDQPRLVRVQLQPEPRKPFTKLDPEPPRIPLVLEPDDDVVGLCGLPGYAASLAGTVSVGGIPGGDAA